jgi:hypothetical protein
MKDQKFLSVIGGLVVLALGIFSSSANAASIDVVADESIPGQVTMLVSGSGFPVASTAGGDWGASWDSSVLQYVSTTIDSAFVFTGINEINVGSGVLDRVDGVIFCPGGCAPGSGLGPDFAIASILFTILLDAPVTFQTAAAFSNPNGWSDISSPVPNAIPIDNYAGASIGAPVPVPAAVWLFGSALGLLGWVRRRTTA